MKTSREGAACAVLLLVATSTAQAGDRPVHVTAPGGVIDKTATIVCADPVLPAATVDAQGRATVAEGCRRIRCDSSRWLPGETVPVASGGATCALKPAAKVVFDFGKEAGGALAVAVTRRGGKRPDFQIESTAVAPGARSRVDTPPLAPGRYDLSIGRPDGSWSCRASMRFTSSEVARIFIPWRDPLMAEGRVTTAEGRGIAGVKIIATSDGAPVAVTGLPPPRGQVEEWRCGVTGNSEIRSGPDGAFRVAVDPQALTLIVAGDWADPHGIDFVSRRGGRAEPMRLVPAISHRARARVLDDSDRPVSCRARLAIDSEDERWAARVVPGGPVDATCAADGGVLAGPFRGPAFTIDLSSDEALPLRVTGEASAGVPLKDLGIIRVDRGTTLHVAVRDDERAPIERARVSVRSRGGFVMERSGKSGADGVALIAGLPPDAPVDVGVEADGFGRVLREGLEPTGEVEVILARTAAVSGRVTAKDGAPVRARVRATSADGHPIGDAEADDSGTFTFHVLPAGVALLQATAQGYTPSQPVRVTVAAGHDVEPVVLVLREGLLMRGTVFDPTRTPVAGAAVLLAAGGVLGDPPESAALAATRTATDGSFVLEGTGASDETVVALAPGYGPGVLRATSIDDPSAIALVLVPEARLRVKVPRSLPSDAMLLVEDGSRLLRMIPVRGRPEILVEGLAPGEGAAALRGGQRTGATLIAGQTAQVDLSEGARVSGHVARWGRPQARAAATIAAVEGESLSTGNTVITGTDGAFSFEGVGPGPCVVIATAGRARAERRIVVPSNGELGVELDLAERGLRVMVRERASGSPVPGARVTVTPRGTVCTAFADVTHVDDGIGWDVSVSDGGCARGTSGADGLASLVLGSGGPHVVSVEARGFTAWTGNVDVVDGVVDLAADLARGGPPIVRVVIDSDPPGIAGSLYCVQDGNGSSHGPVAGEGTCEGLAPGPADVAFRVADFGLARANVDVPETGDVTVTLNVLRGGQLVAPMDPARVTSVRVSDDHGAVWNYAYGLGWPRCGGEGFPGIGSAYVCHELPPGTYTVETDGQRRATVVVRGGETAIAY